MPNSERGGRPSWGQEGSGSRWETHHTEQGTGRTGVRGQRAGDQSPSFQPTELAASEQPEAHSAGPGLWGAGAEGGP